MQIEVFLTPHGVLESDVRDKTVVIIDVLRTASTIITALHNGAKSVVPAATQGDAGRIAQNLDPTVFLLGGEKENQKIDGYHLGNSPQEYTEEKVRGRTLILHTSSTTGTILFAKSARSLIIGGLINYRKIVQHIRKEDSDVAIICTGTRNRVSIADTVCAGLILNSLWQGNRPKNNVSDAVAISHTVYQDYREELESAIMESLPGRELREQGFESDVEYCVGLNTVPVLPEFDTNTLSIVLTGDDT